MGPKKKNPPVVVDPAAEEGQGYNHARGEIEDEGDIPEHNALNVNNDPAHVRRKETEGRQNDGDVR